MSDSQATKTCKTCLGTRRVLHMWDRPGGSPGNGWGPCLDCAKTHLEIPSFVPVSIDPWTDKTKTSRTKIWFDTEFIEDGRTIDLISIGMVREDGATFYAENAECNRHLASDWVKENVFPHLIGGHALASRSAIAKGVCLFVGKHPEFWAYYAAYDWVALCQLYGTMMDLPKGWPMFCLDIRQAAYVKGDPCLPKQEKGEHNALADAHWNRTAWEFIHAR